MSDSFADLWSSSAPLPPKPKPQTLSSASSSTSGSSRPNLNSSKMNSSSKPDVFTLLSSSGTSTPTSRYGNGSSFITSSSSTNTLNATRPSNPPSRTVTPSTSSQIPMGASLSTGGGGDAFSDLFASSSTAPSSNMTLAARLALETEQRRRGSESSSSVIRGKQQQVGSGSETDNDSAWVGLDSLASGPSSTSVARPAVPSMLALGVDEDDWGLGDFGKAKPTVKVDPTRQPQSRTQTAAQSIPQAAEEKKAVSLWDLDDFSTTSTSATSVSRENSSKNTSFNFQPNSHPSSSSQNKPPFRNTFADEDINSPDVDFDFGGREDRTESRQSERRVQKGLLDLNLYDEDHSYIQANGHKRGMSRGLLDNDDDDDHGYGHTASNGRSRGRADDDDILGMLSKPVEVVRARVEVEATSQSTRGDGSNNRNRTSSPPPHILGQIVEMGFSIGQAKKALSATKDGQDVQAALESLLGGAGASESTPDQSNDNYSRERPPRDPFRPSASSTSQQSPPPPPTRTRGAPKGQKERERERLERQRQASNVIQDTVPSSVAEMQEQADKLLAQASEIGLSVFSKASAFWKEGTERVVKAYEERASDTPGIAGRGLPNAAAGGRPKWMQGVHTSDDEEDYERRGSGFKDTHETSPGRVVEPKPAAAEVDLFADGSETQRYRKPFPQPKPGPIRQTSSSSSVRAPSPQSQPPSRRNIPVTKPVPIPTRTLVIASPSALAVAQKYKTVGTEQFKLGQHGPAAESYTSAILALPADHLLLVPLHTNRALARLKTGEYAGAITDCERAVEGILGKAIFSRETGDNTSTFGVEDPLAAKTNSSSSLPPPLLQHSIIPPNLITAGRSRANGGGWTHPQGLGVDLLDSYVKALRRAAEAFEGREKWVEACAWWGVLSRVGEGDGPGWVDEKARKEAVVGSIRCRKMVDGSGDGQGVDIGSTTATTKPPASKPKPKPKPRPAVTSTEPSRALQALQSSNAQAEADDAAKHALKDSVDARLSAWKTGKETNIRALLASLETVLWEGSNGVQGLKMGMADLVSAGQVKKGYMKAIARVHPDKLNSGNSTLEQRMLANGVFGGLNEAWIAFQASQK